MWGVGGYAYPPKVKLMIAVQIILASARMNVQLNIQLSQGSAAANVRGGGTFCSNFLYVSYRNAKKLNC